MTPDPTERGGLTRYRCPNEHEWWSVNEGPPLVNIKCPNCGATAMQLPKGHATPRWQIEPLRTLIADVPAIPPEASDDG